ncbi:MAG: hypothetical protein GX357_03480 [Firmicutes bacterium]|nr:hypothetical protein [Bacillota bacterium]
MHVLRILPTFLRDLLPLQNNQLPPVLPNVLTAEVKEISGKAVILRWQHKLIHAVLETKVKEGEKLLLQLTDEKDGLKYYKVLARYSEDIDPNIGWYTLQLPEQEMNPPFIAVKKQKKSANTPFWLDIVLPTANMGIVGVRIYSLQKPYPCSFLVENKEYGKLLTDSALSWLAAVNGEELPLELKPFVLIRRQDYLQSSLFDHKA